MEPLSQGASLAQIQSYVATMEAERHLDKQDLPSQCLKLGEEVGELYRAVRNLQGTPKTPAAGSPTSATKPPIPSSCSIRDLAQGGADDPAQMIALCPNCHAIKTRGSTREQLRDLLLVTAEQRHTALLARSRSPGHGDTLPRNDLPPILAVLDIVDELGPRGGIKLEPRSVGVLGVADQVTDCGPGDFDAVIASSAAAGLAPGQGGVLGVFACAQRRSLARSAIITAEAAGSSACSDIWFQARTYRSVSPFDSRYRSPNIPSV